MLSCDTAKHKNCSCQHLHYYIYDQHVTIITDHEPLEKSLLSYIKPPSTNQRWFLRLQSYNCILQYPPGNSNAADCLSRNPKATNSSSNENIAEQHINSVSIHEPSKNWAIHHKQPCIMCYRKIQINGTNN